MDSYEFTEYEHCTRQGDLPNDLWDFDKCVPLFAWTYVGWCPSASTCRPVSGWGEKYSIAVMLENSKGERAWLHVKPNQEIINVAY